MAHEMRNEVIGYEHGLQHVRTMIKKAKHEGMCEDFEGNQNVKNL